MLVGGITLAIYLLLVAYYLSKKTCQPIEKRPIKIWTENPFADQNIDKLLQIYSEG